MVSSESSSLPGKKKLNHFCTLYVKRPNKRNKVISNEKKMLNTLLLNSVSWTHKSN